jgi:hypothetical protein
LGASRTLESEPLLYTDSKCDNLAHINIKNISEYNLHLVCVANGATKACRDFHKNTRGNLIITSSEERFPFSVKSIYDDNFIHIFDEISLENIMKELDTISDFIEYLNKKKELMQKKEVLISGEEDLLAVYLQNIGNDNLHNFGELEKKEKSFIFLEEGI